VFRHDLDARLINQHRHLRVNGDRGADQLARLNIVGRKIEDSLPFTFKK
jgi:hypothetical protein